MNRAEKRETRDLPEITQNRANKRSGYVLLATLMLIALGIGLISTVAQRAISYQRIMRVTLEREKARMLALGGIQIALAQVSFINDDGQEQKKQQDQSRNTDQDKSEEQNKLNPDQRWLLQLLPVINKWQQFAFTQEKDKLEGTLSVYISSEQGKFDLVTLLESPKPPAQSNNNRGAADKEKKEKEQLKVFINEQVGNRMAGIKPIDIAQQVQKQLGRNLEDATELTKDKNMQAAFQDKLFTTHVTTNAKKQESKDDKSPVYLTDIFTTRSRSGKLNPWFMSTSVGALVELQIKDASDMQKWQQAVKQWQPEVNWASVWDKTLKDIYGKAYQALPQVLRDNLNSEFEATAFLAVSSATVGSVTQTVAALMQESDFFSQSYQSNGSTANTTEHTTGTTGQPRKPESRIFALTKLYWL